MFLKIEADSGLFYMFMRFHNVIVEVQKFVEQNKHVFCLIICFLILISSFCLVSSCPKLVVFTHYSVLKIV